VERIHPHYGADRQDPDHLVRRSKSKFIKTIADNLCDGFIIFGENMKNKRIKCVLLLCAVCTMLCGCGGRVQGAEKIVCASEIYTPAEIDAAINAAMAYFKMEFEGCTLKYIGYAGDETAEEAAEWEQQCGSRVIVLTSEFYVDASGGDGSLTPSSTYTGWKWILKQNILGAWEHVTHGYG